MNYQKVKLGPGLHFVGTPIGTARDITLRALDVLASADLIAAEDTRSLRHLMDIHGIPLGGRQVIAYHDHSGPGVRAKLVEAMAAGRSVAYASEAGMPLIADPGYDLSRAVAEAGRDARQRAEDEEVFLFSVNINNASPVQEQIDYMCELTNPPYEGSGDCEDGNNYFFDYVPGEGETLTDIFIEIARNIPIALVQ